MEFKPPHLYSPPFDGGPIVTKFFASQSAQDWESANRDEISEGLFGVVSPMHLPSKSWWDRRNTGPRQIVRLVSGRRPRKKLKDGARGLRV